MKINFFSSQLHNICGRFFLLGIGPPLEANKEKFEWVTIKKFNVINPEIGEYFVRTLVYDESKDIQKNLIMWCAHSEGKLSFIAELSTTFHDNTFPVQAAARGF